MGVRLVFYFMILLLPSLAACDFGCRETCGNVSIPFPFGIKTGCYYNSWFRVTCNETANGLKPFISRINLELLGWALSAESAVRVNNPVTYLNCGNKGKNGTTSPASVNLDGSPFFFPSEFNVFGSVGCGNLATVFGDNRTCPIAGCLQQRCGDLTSKLGGCYDRINEDLISYAATITDIINPGRKEYSKRCTSAFLFDSSELIPSDPADEFPQNINFDTTHVPATLAWNPVKCDLEAAACQNFAQHGTVPLPHKSGCIESCGNVSIPFPFGIKADCYMNDWFKVTCNETADGRKPFISSINMQLLDVSFSRGTVLVNNSITYFNCLDKDRENNGVSVNLTGSPFVFSHTDNLFVSVGCGSFAAIFRSPTDDYPADGCVQHSCDNTVAFDFSCSTGIPPGLRSFVANMTDINYPSNGGKRSCGSAFIVDKSFPYSLETENSDHNDRSKWNWTHVPTSLQWGTPKDGLCKLTEDSRTFCSSDGPYCWTCLGRTDLCVCTLDSNYGYNYSAEVCQVTETSILCLNAPGNNFSLPCRHGYEYSSMVDKCEPIKLISPPKSPEVLTKKSDKSQNLPIIIACCTSIGTVFVLFGPWQMYRVLERRKNIKMKQKYFKRNGGLLLQEQLSNNEGNVKKIKLFSSKELEKATDYYNENRILGQGGQGTVYKGMLADGSIVAIKKSKMVEEKNLDEWKLAQFINEVIILSQINHRNVVKLLGCCLETEVPLLVYEFIPNGTLSQLVREPNEEFPLTWEKRLRIAIEIANALSYLHSAASVPIYHRDIKSSNILLDDKYRAKVSDFGTSRTVALEQTHVTTRVQGTFGYLDPEYFRSNQFTEKSDVYSFGVVLAELLTGQKPISSRQSEEVARSLVTFFLLSMKENTLFDILDPKVMNNGPQEEIIAVAKLAKRCLNLTGKKRPTMKQVALELEWIRSSEEVNAIQQSADQDSDTDDMIEPSATSSCSTYGSILNNSVTLTLDR